MPESFRFVAGRWWDESPLLVVALIENPQGRWRTTTRYIHLVIQWPNESKTICRKLQKKIEATNCCKQLQKNVAESRMWTKSNCTFVLTFLPTPPLSRRSSSVSGRVCLSVQTTQKGVKATSWRTSKNHWGRMNECKEKDPQQQRKKNWVQRKRSTTSKEEELGASARERNLNMLQASSEFLQENPSLRITQRRPLKS